MNTGNPTETELESGQPEYIGASQWLAENNGVVSKNTFYKGVRENQVPHVRIGKRILVRRDLLAVMEANAYGSANSG